MSPRDLDWGDVHADAANDPTLDRPCEEGVDCADPNCPLRHTRTAHVYDDPERVARYLPSNYEVTGTGHDPALDRDYAVVTGEDVAGWTLDGYVIPRLASGLISAYEVLAD